MNVLIHSHLLLLHAQTSFMTLLPLFIPTYIPTFSSIPPIFQFSSILFFSYFNLLISSSTLILLFSHHSDPVGSLPDPLFPQYLSNTSCIRWISCRIFFIPSQNDTFLNSSDSDYSIPTYTLWFLSPSVSSYTIIPTLRSSRFRHAYNITSHLSLVPSNYPNLFRLCCYLLHVPQQLPSLVDILSLVCFGIFALLSSYRPQGSA